jgi:hypothetical protein
MDYAKAKESAFSGAYLLPSSSCTIWTSISSIRAANDPTAIPSSSFPFTLTELSQTVDVEDAKHILQNDKLLGDRVGEIVKEWDAQKEEFYPKTGVSPGDELAVVDNDEPEEFLDENDGHTKLAVIDNDKSGEFYDEDGGFDELEQLLLE